MSLAPHPVVCPQFFEVGIDTEESLGDSKGATKVQLAEDGIFFLENHKLKCKRHRLPTISLANDVWDIDYDDNMLLALSFDGSVVAWKGEVESYAVVEEEDIETLSRKLLVLPELSSIDIPHLICLRGDVGLVCVISRNTLHIVKIEGDLSISLSNNIDIKNKMNPNFIETVTECKIWGHEVLYVAYAVLGNDITVYSVDPTNKDVPCKLCHVHQQDNWVSSLSNGHYPIYVAGDSGGVLSIFTTDYVGSIEMENDTNGKEDQEGRDKTAEFRLITSVNSFADSPVAITSLLVTEDNIVWVGTSNGVVYCCHFDHQGETPNLVKFKKIRLHCAGWGPCVILWEPYTDNVNESDWHRMNGVLTSVCKETGMIAQSEVFDFSDLVCNCCPVSIETQESVGHRLFVKSCVCLSHLNMLVVVNESSEVTLWNLLTGVVVLELNTEAIKGKVINVMAYEYAKTERNRTNFVLFLGLIDGSMYIYHISRFESQLMYEFQQSSTVYSVLDLIGTISKNLPSKGTGDDDSSVMGIQDLDSVGSDQQERDAMVEIPGSWEVNSSRFCPKFKQPPLPVSDIFISTQGQYICACYARSCVYVYEIDSGVLAYHVNLDYDEICDISKVVSMKRNKEFGDSHVEGSYCENDSLVLVILGRSVLKLFDALRGVIVKEVKLEDDDYTVSVADKLQFCGAWDLSEMDGFENDFVGMLVTNSGNVYAFGNVTPMVLVHERNTSHDTRSRLDAMDVMPLGIEVFDVWSAFIVIIRYVRSTTVFKFDARDSFFSVVKYQTFTIENKKVNIVKAYPLEGDYFRLAPRFMIALSDGTTCSFNM